MEVFFGCGLLVASIEFKLIMSGYNYDDFVSC